MLEACELLGDLRFDCDFLYHLLGWKFRCSLTVYKLNLKIRQS